MIKYTDPAIRWDKMKADRVESYRNEHQKRVAEHLQIFPSAFLGVSAWLTTTNGCYYLEDQLASHPASKRETTIQIDKNNLQALPGQVINGLSNITVTDIGIGVLGLAAFLTVRNRFEKKTLNFFKKAAEPIVQWQEKRRDEKMQKLAQQNAAKPNAPNGP